MFYLLLRHGDVERAEHWLALLEYAELRRDGGGVSGGGVDEG